MIAFSIYSRSWRNSAITFRNVHIVPSKAPGKIQMLWEKGLLYPTRKATPANRRSLSPTCGRRVLGLSPPPG